MKLRMNRMRWIVLLCLIPVIGLASGLALTSGIDKAEVAAAAAPASVTVTPEEAYNPVRTQHTFTATVKDSSGTAVGGTEIQWILCPFPETVGAIIDASNAVEVTNERAVAKTDSQGQATLTICATRPGDTDLIVYVPGIADTSKHKVFAVKHWEDIKVTWPADAVNKIGTEHTFTVKVTKVDGTPMSGVDVKWTVTDDSPNIKIKSSGTNTAKTATDSSGTAAITIQQVTAAAGENTVRIEVLGTSGNVMFSHDAKKTWQAPSLKISKTGPDREELGKTVEYVIQVNNNGDSTAASVKVVDTVPAGLTYLSSTPSGTKSGNTVTWNIGNLAVNGSSKITAKFTAAKVGDWTNTVKATSAEGISAQASATITIYGEAVLDITKTGPASVTKGDKAEYTITVENKGNIDAKNTVLKDRIPACLTYSSSSPAATVSGGVATWQIGDLAPGIKKTYTLTLTAAVVGTCTNTAEAVADNADKVEASVVTEVVKPLVPAVTITKSGPDTLYLKTTGTFTITVTNNGETSLTSVVVTDTLPANLTYQSSSPAASSVVGKTLKWSLPSMNVGETKQITLVCQGSSVGTFVNNVSVATAEGVSATASASGRVVAEPGMTMQITDTVDPVAVGSQTTYEVTLKNQGEITVHNLKLVLSLPSSVSYVSASGPLTYSVSGNKVTFDGAASLSAGQSMKFYVTVKAVSAGPAICTATMTFDEFALPVSADEGTTIYSP
jgi:uncharacterized repeat protein (TIGR01451 family)